MNVITSSVYITIYLVCSELFSIVESNGAKDSTSGSFVEASISDRVKETLVLQNTSFLITFDPPASYEENIKLVAERSNTALYPYFITLGLNQTSIKIPVECLDAGNCPFHLEPTENSTFISNLDEIGFTLSCFKYEWLVYISSIVGWTYFASWTLTFYPQIYMNIKSRSIKGYSFSYLLLNIIGFFCYNVYNLSFYYSSAVHSEFFKLYPQSQVPVQLNDVCFSVHGFLCCLVMTPQFYFFRSTSNQKTPLWVKITLMVFSVYLLIITVILWAGSLNIVEYLILFSYVKVVVTVVKYIPQLVLNQSGKSTRGFSMLAANLDLTGSVFSIAQSVLIAFNNNDWVALTADPTKQALALLGVFYNICFNIQYFVFNARKNNCLVNDAINKDGSEMETDD